MDKQSIELSRCLIEHHSILGIDLKSLDGRTALDIAEKADNQPAMELLKTVLSRL